MMEEIKLPNNMNKYNSELILDLIEKVIPKLSRSRKEDMSNGLNIRTRKSENKRTIVQSETPKQFEAFKGSRYSRIVKTEIKDDQIKRIKSEGNVYLKSQPEEGQIVFGPKDFSFHTKSEIVSNELHEEKENVELVKKLVSKFTFVNPKDLVQSKKEEIIEEETKPLRNLA